MSDYQNPQLEKAQPTIKRHVLFAMGAGFIPMPVLDIAAVTAIQLDMIKQLCKLYGQDYSESSGKAFVGALAGTTLARISAASVGSLLKVIPVIGSMLGGVTVSVFSGAVTYAIGQAVSQHFATGGTIAEFDEEDLKAFYEEQLKKGRDIVKEWKKEADKATDNEATNPTIDDRLGQLEELKAAGIITDHEFERMKKRVLKEVNKGNKK